MNSIEWKGSNQGTESRENIESRRNSCFDGTPRGSLTPLILESRTADGFSQSSLALSGRLTD